MRATGCPTTPPGRGTTSTPAEFCDTNVLVYAFDRAVPAKHAVARQLVDRLDDDENGAASIQVLQELYVTLTRKLAPPMAPDLARTVIADLLTWRIVEPSAEDVLAAIDNALGWQLSFWDAMLITTAERAGAGIVWSEDMTHGRLYGSVTVRNPFL